MNRTLDGRLRVLARDLPLDGGLRLGPDSWCRDPGSEARRLRSHFGRALRANGWTKRRMRLGSARLYLWFPRARLRPLRGYPGLPVEHLYQEQVR